MLQNTPIELYQIDDTPIWVKREDIAAIPPAPTFSKIRGLVAYLEKVKKQGVRLVGYTETAISMAGWGVAWASDLLGLKAVIFDPQYKKTPALLRYHRKHWEQFSPQIIPIKAGRAKVNWYISKKILKDMDLNCIMLPLGLPLEETIEETANQFRQDYLQLQPKSIIVNVGSGTIAAGIWRGLPLDSEITVYGIMGRTGSIDLKLKMIAQKSKRATKSSGLFQENNKFQLIDPGHDYMDRVYTPCPFPCHPYYDRKAWKWTVENIETLKPPILFWNIGSMGSFKLYA